MMEQEVLCVGSTVGHSIKQNSKHNREITTNDVGNVKGLKLS